MIKVIISCTGKYDLVVFVFYGLFFFLFYLNAQFFGSFLCCKPFNVVYWVCTNSGKTCDYILKYVSRYRGKLVRYNVVSTLTTNLLSIT